MTATGKWIQDNVPHKGWSCIDVEDVGEPTHLCEMCETQMVRYVHTMEHADYEGTLDVGSVCAGNMEGDYTAARQREDRLKRAGDRRKRWLQQRGWHKSYSGNEYINTGDGFNVVVFKRGDFWSGRIQHRPTREQIFARRRYRTAEQVKLAAFDAMMMMKRKIGK